MENDEKHVTIHEVFLSYILDYLIRGGVYRRVRNFHKHMIHGIMTIGIKPALNTKRAGTLP